MNNCQPLKILAHTDNLKVIRRYIEVRLSDHRVKNHSNREDILLTAMEANSNICIHGYQGQKGIIEVEVAKGRDSIKVCLRDGAPDST